MIAFFKAHLATATNFASVGATGMLGSTMMIGVIAELAIVGKEEQRRIQKTK